ncbi:hypothetical protein FJ366_00180 [Candidatus Dependentiae bacterium]|nr:hypothetical protein [Candidatus Dependentiae bacterium]
MSKLTKVALFAVILFLLTPAFCPRELIIEGKDKSENLTTNLWTPQDFTDSDIGEIEELEWMQEITNKDLERIHTSLKKIWSEVSTTSLSIQKDESSPRIDVLPVFLKNAISPICSNISTPISAEELLILVKKTFDSIDALEKSDLLKPFYLTQKSNLFSLSSSHHITKALMPSGLSEGLSERYVTAACEYFCNSYKPSVALSCATNLLKIFQILLFFSIAQNGFSKIHKEISLNILKFHLSYLTNEMYITLLVHLTKTEFELMLKLNYSEIKDVTKKIEFNKTVIRFIIEDYLKKAHFS